LIDFRPTKANSESKMNLPNFWEFSKRSGAKNLQRAWKNNDIKPEFHSSGGHVITTHKSVFPFNFLLMHFPIRNQTQGLQKIFHDRLPRFATEKENLGWHTQYDTFSPDSTFVWNEGDLNLLVNDLQFEYLPEVLGRCNIFPPVDI
jgi:hypothetical protein